MLIDVGLDDATWRRMWGLLTTFDDPLDMSVFDGLEPAPSRLEREALEAFRVLANKVVDLASNLLGDIENGKSISSPATSQELGEMVLDRPVSSRGMFAAFSQPVERSIARLILKLAAQKSHTLLDWLSTDLAQWVLDLARCGTKLESALAERQSGFVEHCQIVREARLGYALDSESGDNLAVCEFLREVFHRKLVERGSPPPLIVLHDFDNSLTVDFETYAPMIPLRNLTTLSRRALDAGMLTRARLRMTLLGGLMNLPAMRSATRRQLQRAVARMRFFEDALSLLGRRSPHITHKILSANFECLVAAAVARVLPDPPEIIALRPDSYRGPEKAMTILGTVMENPDAITIVVDDGDHRLLHAIEDESLFPDCELAPRLQDCVILCVRRDRNQPGRFPLYPALHSRKIVHGVNEAEGISHGCHGYQGVRALMECFKTIRAREHSASA